VAGDKNSADAGRVPARDEDARDSISVVETPIVFATAAAIISKLSCARSSASGTANRRRNRLGSSLQYVLLAPERTPAVARVAVEDDAGALLTYYICRATPLSGFRNLASYRAPIGRLASMPIGGEFTLPGGRYRLKPILDPNDRDAYGNPSRIGTVLEIDKVQAETVAEIFASYARGVSYFAIARTPNERGVPSPGSSWKRRVRRCRGWVGSAVRVVLRNPLYTGHVRWNVSQFVRDPDTGAYKRRKRTEAEWVHHHDESLRIVSDELFETVRARLQRSAASGNGLRTGSNVKFLLSGFLVCDSCGANYVMGDAYKYACSSYTNGRACSNGIRVRRDKLETAILGPIQTQLREPGRVKKMALEMQTFLAQELQERADKSAEVPGELLQLEARLERLRRRLADGDPDIAPDELQAAIERAEAKRRQLQLGISNPVHMASAQVLSIVPRAAALYDQQITKGLDGDPEASTDARLILKDLIPNRIRLSPKADGTLWARFDLHPAALLSIAGERGRGEGICQLYAHSGQAPRVKAGAR
jgi:site-specific DNA recombinase